MFKVAFRIALHVAAMDAIKKKMQAMKVEKDNACDRSDQCEEASKAAKVSHPLLTSVRGDPHHYITSAQSRQGRGRGGGAAGEGEAAGD